LITIICLILLMIMIYACYVLSLYSSAAYLEVEELEHIVNRLSGYRKKHLEIIIDNPRKPIQLALVFKSFALVVSTLIGVLLSGYLAEAVPIPAWVVYGIVLLMIWLVYLILGEFLPRRRVFKATEKKIIKHLPLFTVIYTFFNPLLTLHSRLFAGNGPRKITEEQREDIIERAIESLAEQSGVDEPIVEDDELEMIGHILQLDATEVREVMVPRVQVKGIEKKSGVDDVRRMTREHGFSRFPVYEENIDRIIGILYVKDLFTSPIDDAEAFDITKWMREPYLVNETRKIGELLAEFKASKTHIAVVVDEYGGTSGLVTLEDILEEIVGEIQDEHDTEVPPLVRLPDNSCRVDAAMPVEDFVEQLDLDYEISGFETISGLIYDLVGSVPSVGAKVKWHDIVFEVEKVEGQRIVSVKAWNKRGTE
jgi:putative hemolysin